MARQDCEGGGVQHSMRNHAQPSSTSSARPLFRGYHLAFAFLLAIQIAEFVAAVIVGYRVFGVSPAQTYTWNDITALLPGWFLIPLAWLGIVAVSMARRKVDRPTTTLWRLIRFRGDWALRGLWVLAGYLAMTKSFTVLKSAIPDIVPFYLDPPLVELDVMLLGQDAWLFARSIAPDWTVIVFDRIYVLWFTYVVICTGVVAFTRDVRLQIKATIAFHLCWFGLGTVVATGMSSVGPVFYDMTYGGNRFSGLLIYLESIHRETELGAVRAMEYLVENFGTTKLGVGISAMPSLHVAMSFYGYLLARHFRKQRFLQWFSLIFTAAMLFGSIQLGWHYLSDGIVGMLCVWAIWRFSGWITDRLYRPGSASQIRQP